MKKNLSILKITMLMTVLSLNFIACQIFDDPILYAPTGVKISSSADVSTISWEAVPNATQYKIRRDGVLVGSVDAPATSWADTGIGGYGQAYTVSAVTEDGEGPQSVEVIRDNIVYNYY